MKNISKAKLKLILIGFLAGVFWLTAMRFILYSPTEIHYHADFAVVISGERETFDSPVYYEEVQSCGGSEANPKARVHMHQPDNNIIHVHDEAVTWAQFFESMGLSLGDTVVTTPQGVFQGGKGGELVFILNGNRTRTIVNTVIGDEDRLLVAFGDSGTDFDALYEGVSSDAAAFNETYDPPTCSGSGADTSFSARLRYALGLSTD